MIHITEPIPATFNLEPDDTKGPDPMFDKNQAIADVAAAGLNPAVIELLSDDVLQAVQAAVQQARGPAGGPAKMSESRRQRLSKFSEGQLQQIGLVARFAEVHRHDLAVVGHTLGSYTRRFEERLNANPRLTAAEFCNVPAHKFSDNAAGMGTPVPHEQRYNSMTPVSQPTTLKNGAGQDLTARAAELRAHAATPPTQLAAKEKAQIHRHFSENKPQYAAVGITDPARLERIWDAFRSKGVSIDEKFPVRG